MKIAIGSEVGYRLIALHRAPPKEHFKDGQHGFMKLFMLCRRNEKRELFLPVVYT